MCSPLAGKVFAALQRELNVEQQLPYAGRLHRERERERGRKRNAGNGGVAVGALVDSAYIL